MYKTSFVTTFAVRISMNLWRSRVVEVGENKRLTIVDCKRIVMYVRLTISPQF